MAVSMFIASFCGPNDTALMFVYFVCIGCGWGINLVCAPTCFANYFGNENFSKIIGWVLPIFSIIAGMIPVIAGARSAPRAATTWPSSASACAA